MTTSVFEDSNPMDQLVTQAVNDLRARFAKEDGTIDTDKLLEAKAHADLHIKNVETEQQNLRGDLKARATLEDLLAKIETAKTSATPEPQISTPPLTPSSDPKTNIEELVERKLASLQMKSIHEANLKTVREELEKVWGSDYVSKLKAKARELGETENDLNTLAATKPKMFLKAILDVSPQGNVSVPSSTVRSVGKQMNTGKTYKDFSKLRRDDPTRYWSPTVQNEMHKLTAEYAARGEDFTKT